MPSDDEAIEGEIWRFLEKQKHAPATGAGCKDLEQNAQLLTNVQSDATALRMAPHKLPAWHYPGDRAAVLPDLKDIRLRRKPGIVLPPWPGPRLSGGACSA